MGDNVLVDLARIKREHPAYLVHCGSDELFERAYKEPRTFIKKDGVYKSITQSNTSKKSQPLIVSFNVVTVIFRAKEFVSL